MIKYFIFIIQVVASASGIVCMKYGFSVRPVFTIYGFPVSVPLIMGIGLYGISFCLNFYVIKTFNLSYAVPVGLGIVYVIVISFSYFFFKEIISLVQFLGITFILIGLVLMNIKQVI